MGKLVSFFLEKHECSVSFQLPYKILREPYFQSFHCIPGRKSGILRIQYGHAAAAAAEISFWTR